MCDEDSDVESVSDDSKDSDEDSGSNSDTSYVDADPSSSDADPSSSNLSGESSSMEVDPPLQPEDDLSVLSVLTTRNAGKWCREWLSSVNSQKLIMTRCRDSLRDYLLCAETSEVSYILIIIWCILTINSRLLKPVWVRGSKQLSHHFGK
jgi:hypothetical protein